MNIARLNFSHGTYANHKILMKNIRKASQETRKTLSVLQDLQGPKIRLGELKKPLKVKKGQKLTLGKGGILVQFDISQIVKAGDPILIDDGLIEARALKVSPGKVEVEFITEGTLISHKGINLPESKTNFSVFTEKDKKDLKFGLQNNVDFVAMSFVRSAKDILEVKKFIKKHSKKNYPWVIAKIEKPQAIKDLNNIITASDGVMVARGDLGIEAQQEEVPVYQKMIIKESLKQGKPVIVATQMLDSMIRNPRPTRAEVSDVSNAVFDHADATMLSGESASGKYPVQSVEVMAKTIIAAEDSYFDDVPLRKTAGIDTNLKEVISLAKKHKLPIVVEDKSGGNISKVLSHMRQEIPLYAYINEDILARQMNLFWGLQVFASNLSGQKIVTDLLTREQIKPGQNLIFVEAKRQKKKEISLLARVVSA